MFFSSSLYHLVGLCHHDHRVARVCYCMDISAIAGLISGSLFPAYHFWMYRYEWWRNTYTIIFAILMIISMGFPYLSAVIPQKAFEMMRTVLFLGIILFGLTPGGHIVALDGWEVPWERNQFIILGSCLMGIFYAIGFFFWVTKIPERFFPGRCDIWLQSHSIWHICIIFATSSWFGALFLSYWISATTGT
jgi:adiponectin receptor